MYLRAMVGAFAGALVLTAVTATGLEAQRRDRDDPPRSDRDDRRGDRDRGDDRLARERGWELLGEKTVGFRVDRDVINLGQNEDWFRDRRYRGLHFLAEGSDIYMIGIRLVYLNGFGEDFRVDKLIRQGEDLPMDLRGERSYLARIEMTYRSRPSFEGQAVVKVFGEPAPRRDRDRRG
jgi:hypothetical protein